MFNNLNWQDDRLLLGGLKFRLQHYKNDNWNGANNHFIFYKIKVLIDQYETFFKNYPENSKPKNVIELGMWDGGSLAFWNEILKPQKIVGIDLIENGGNDYFQEYLQNTNKPTKKVIPYWATNQADAPLIREIIAENFSDEPIDLVFDDASHMYAPSLASFNAIFPYLAVGGIYIIEDWAWSHWKDKPTGLPADSEPTKLIQEIVQAAGNRGLIESVTVFEGFVVVKRGNEPINVEKKDFEIHDYIYNIPLSFKSKIKAALRIFGLYKK